MANTTPSPFAALVLAWVGSRTIAECADLLGVTRATIYDWLQGHHIPPRTRWRYMAARFGIDERRLHTILAADYARRHGRTLLGTGPYPAQNDSQDPTAPTVALPSVTPAPNDSSEETQ